MAKYDSPAPEGFNAWDQVRRMEWVEAHRLDKKKSPPSPFTKSKPPVPSVSLTEPRHIEPQSSVYETREVEPPNSAPPPTARPVEPDYRQEAVKKLAEDLHTLQGYYNANVKPPADWETVWVDECSKLCELTEGRDPYLPRWWMLKDLIVLSQVKYATKHTSPALIAEHIPELAEEVLALRIGDEFEAMQDMYFKALAVPMKNDDDLDALSLEDKAKDKHKNAEIGLNHWTKWMAKHRQLNQSEANVA